MANVFDQFDAPNNVFDQFDKPVEPKKEEPKEDSSLLRQAADIPLGIAKGAATGFRLIADAFGADNPVSAAIKNTEDYLGGLFSAQSKRDSQEVARIMKEAEDKGVGDQVRAALQAFSTAPVDLVTQALGTAAPVLAGGILGIATRLGFGAATTALGGAMGAGTVKSTIYDAVKDALIEAGELPQVAEERAKKAQEYTGDNWGSILAGTALGAVAGRTGIEKQILGRYAQKQAAAQAPKGAIRRGAEGAVTEAIPEVAQAGQEQLAENIALQKEGFDVPTFRGVAGAGALEGLAGGALGAGVGVADAPKSRGIKDQRIREAVERFGAEDERAAGEASVDTRGTEPSVSVPPRGDEAPAEPVVTEPERLGSDIESSAAPAGGEGAGDAALETTPEVAPEVTPEVTPVADEYDSTFRSVSKDDKLYKKYDEIKALAKDDYATANENIKKLEDRNRSIFDYLKQSGVNPNEYLAAGSSKSFEGLSQEQQDGLSLLRQGINEIQYITSDIRTYEAELAKAQEEAKTKEKVEGEEVTEEKKNIQGIQRKIEANRQAKLLREQFAKSQEQLRARVDAGVSNADRFLQDPVTYDKRDDANVDFDTGEVTPGRALLFSRQTDPQARGMKKADVDNAVSDVTSVWTNSPKVTTVQSISELSPEIQELIKEQGVTPKGLYVTSTKEVFIVADNVTNRTDAILTLIHETMGHFGMRSILGDRYKPVMLEIYNSNAEVKKLADAYRKENPKASIELATEEVMAEMAVVALNKYNERRKQKSALPKPLRQLIQFLRRVLSQIPGIRMNNVTDWDVVELISNAGRFVQEGRINYDRFTQGKLPKAPAKPAKTEALARSKFQGRAGPGRTAPMGGPTTWDKAKSYLNPMNLTRISTPNRKLVFKTFTLRMLKDIVGDSLNGVKNAIGVIERMSTTRNQIMKTGGEILDKKIMELNKKDPDQLRLLGEVAVEATRREIDPDTQRGKDKALDDAWDLMTDDAKETYRAIRKFYEDQIKGIINDLKDRMRQVYANDPVKMQEALVAIDKEFTAKLKGPYFPLRRFGNYWFQVGEGKDKEFYMFESAFDRDHWMKVRKEELAAANNPAEVAFGDSIREGADSAHGAMGSNALFQEIDKMLDGVVTSGRDPLAIRRDLEDSIKQLVYLTLPQGNFRRMFINRKGVQGASTDIARIFAGSVVNIAYQRARLKHSDEYYNAVEGAFGELEGMPSGKQKQFLQDVAEELESRNSHVLGVEPTTAAHKAANLGTQFTFLWLLTSPASAMVNVIGAGTIGGSYIGARYGYLQTSNKILKYMKAYAATAPKVTEGTTVFPTLEKATKLNALQKKAYDRFLHDNAIDVTLQHDLAGVSERPSALYTGTMNKAVQVMSSLFHNSERASREVLSMAAFDLAYEKAKRDKKSDEDAFEFAIQEAKDLVMMSVGDFTRASKPPVLTGPVTKLMFQFKQYSLLMTYNILRNTYIGFWPKKNATKEEKLAAKEARRRMYGTLGTTFLFAGAKGMPIFTVGMMLIEMLSMLGDEEDEIEDGEEWLYRHLEDTVGAKNAQALMRGVVTQATNVSLTERTSLDLADLWFRDSGNQKTNEDEARAWLINFMGPTVGLGLSIPKAVDLVNNGQPDRALESLLPTVFRSIAISARYAEEGAKTTRGVVIKPEEDITYGDLFMRGLGFTPEDVMQKQKEIIARKGMAQKIEYRRDKLLTALFNSYDVGDDEAFDIYLDKIIDLSIKYPELGITSETINESLSRRIKDRIEQQELGGVDKKLYPRLIEEVRER